MLKQTDRLDKTEPTLIVKYGNAAKRYLALDRTSVIMGRARGCDIELDAPDVSLVHCVVTRGPNGLTIRDCGSRAGTKVNGVKVQEATLHNADIVLIGLFSFEVYLPWQTETPDVETVRQEVYKEQLKRLEKSRERLANLALAMRRRLHEERSNAFGVGSTAVAVEVNTPIPAMASDGSAAPSAETLPDKPHQLRVELDKALVQRQEEMTRQLQTLDERVREYDQKLVALEQREQDLQTRQQTLEQQQQQQDLTARQLVEAQARFDGERDMVFRDLLVYRDHLAKARQQVEMENRRRPVEAHGADMATTGPLPEEVRRLDRRQRELDCFARHLRRALVNQKHEQARYAKALSELQSLLTEACQYQRVGLETLQDARESLLRVHDEGDRDFT